MNPKMIYQIKVTLDDSKPPIWRRLLVPGNVNLYDLHAILQIAMGWTNSHLHMFRVGEQIYGDPEDDEYGELGTKNERKYPLNKVTAREGMRFHYEYDFGDSWDHILLVEKILPAEKGVRYPVCIAGKRACPPEDVGGVWGYEDFLKIIADPNHEEHDETLEWADGDFDPDKFDLDKVNAALRHYKRFGEDVFEDDGLAEDNDADLQKLVQWVQALSEEQVRQFDALPLRRDMLAFLSYLAGNRVTGTQSTGNLPLKVVRAICEQFVQPPTLDHVVGDQTFKLRSEDDVFPLIFIHILAHVSEMVTGGPARLWLVTEEGQKFPQLPPPVQVVFLLQQWWHRVNWGICFPFSGLEDGLPPGFNQHVLACLLELPIGESSSYETFANRLIEQSGLTWPSQDQTHVRLILGNAIERMVVDPLVTFSLLETSYVTKVAHLYASRKLDSICLTPTGKGMLELLK